MRIKQLSIRGFRGFNDQQTLVFHPNLTVIYAPNSYGKTSISEAIEWLLYGTTSKLDHADSKDEYRGSLRNLHLPETLVTEVGVTFSKGDITMEYQSQLINGESIQRMVDGKPVSSWPIQTEIERAARPFILQHTLKHLLLARPTERFEGIARLLGFNTLDQIQKDIVSLCTKPEAHMPLQVQELRRQVSEVESRLQSRSDLAHILKAYKKGSLHWTITANLLREEARKYVSSATTDDDLLCLLQKQREEAVRRIFSGNLYLRAYSELEQAQLQTEGQYFLGCLTQEFVASYAKLIGLATNQALNERIQFLRLGIQLISIEPGICPLCDQPIAPEHYKKLHSTHEQMQTQQNINQALIAQQKKVACEVKTLRTRLEHSQNSHIDRLASLVSLAIDTNKLDELEKLIREKQASDVKIIKEATRDVLEIRDRLVKVGSDAFAALDVIESSLCGERLVEEALMVDLGEKLINYVAGVKVAIEVVNKYAPSMNSIDRMLLQELDRRAGTEKIGILIDLLQHRSLIAKKLEIDAILDGLKDFRKSVDRFVSTEIEDTVKRVFTEDVYIWYKKIRTTADPDVHFGGFDLDRTVKGEAKARKIRINATSYGKDLASAVSSLSESKLNVLGICISIAMNLRNSQLFKFLVIDDPIQSLDAEHETQFVEVIRELVEQGKQVILLSHNRSWVNAVRSGCRSMNGLMYEMTGYKLSGPCIVEKPWASLQERLKEVDAILNNQFADTIRLQHAEEEIRIIVCELAVQIVKKVHGRLISPHDLNASKVRSLLIECDIDQKLIDSIGKTFSTTDSAHHAPKDYVPNRQRIQQYRGYLDALEKVLKNAQSVSVRKASGSSKVLPTQQRPVQPDVLENTSDETNISVAPPTLSSPKGD